METFYAPTRAAWRKWLQKHAENTSEVWLLYRKKTAGERRIPYADAVEEALCFGWIDGMIRRVDAEFYMQRFTPRRPQSRWSALNIKRAKKMIETGKMTALGLKVFDPDTTRPAAAKPAELPPELQRKFQANSAAWTAFQQFPPGYRRMTIAWVADAKREETRERRLQALISNSAAHRRIKFM